jgi:uncharacterized protein (DUF1778 family)
MTASTVTREKTINLRATPAQKVLIERAAEAMGTTRTAFVLDATLLADRVRFALSDAQAKRFEQALDEPLPNPDALRRLLVRQPRWSR